MRYNFDKIIERENTNCVKYDLRKQIFGTTDLIPMWVADMDYETPDVIMDAIKKRLEHPILGYSFRPESFYKSIIDWMEIRHQWDVKKEWISFSPGVVPALNMIVLGLSEPLDKIIVQPPVYFPFFTAIENHGRKLINNPLIIKNSRLSIDFNDLNAKIKNGAKMLFLCNPHNPGGSVWKREELLKIADLCLKNNVVVVSDEIHSDLIFSPHKHIPFASLSKEIADITVTCMAPSKTFNIAGLSTSFLVISNQELLKKYNKTLDNIHVGQGNIFGAIALETAYNQGSKWLDELLDYLKKNIDFVEDFLKNNIPEIKICRPEATYMIWLDCSDLNMDDKILKRFFIKETKIGLNDGSVFGIGGEGFQRMNIACPLSVIEQALFRLKNALKINASN
ncbi:MAG: PatB family C-S lyase [Bacteroidales bacterium]|nr:PatB family C-S lyase [Bacteroidales bacterium]